MQVFSKRSSGSNTHPNSKRSASFLRFFWLSKHLKPLNGDFYWAKTVLSFSLSWNPVVFRGLLWSCLCYLVVPHCSLWCAVLFVLSRCPLLFPVARVSPWSCVFPACACLCCCIWCSSNAIGSRSVARLLVTRLTVYRGLRVLVIFDRFWSLFVKIRWRYPFINNMELKDSFFI